MFTKKDSSVFRPLIPGVRFRPLVFGQKTHLCEFMLEKGFQIPWHQHPYEQTGRLLKGRIVLTIADEKAEMNPGDCWIVPGNTTHGAEIMEDSVAIEVFSPVREDYLQYFQK